MFRNVFLLLLFLLASCSNGSLVEYILGRSDVVIYLPNSFVVDNKTVELSGEAYYSVLHSEVDNGFSYHVTLTYYPEYQAELSDEPKGIELGCGNFKLIRKTTTNILGVEALGVLCEVGENQLSYIHSFVRKRQHIVMSVTSNRDNVDEKLNQLVRAMRIKT